MRGLRGTFKRRGMAGIFTMQSARRNFTGSDLNIAPSTAKPTATVMPVPIGRQLSYEEGMAQVILRAHQTIDGNQLVDLPSSAAAGLAALQASANAPRTGQQSFIRMGIEGQAPAEIDLPAQGSTVTVVQFTVPPRRDGTIEAISNQLVGPGWTEGTGAVVWKLLIDGAAVEGYENITASLGNMAQPRQIGRGDGGIAIHEGQLVQLTVSNVLIPIGGSPVIGSLQGHFFPTGQGASDWW